jgi:salicylate hydroxylase
MWQMRDMDPLPKWVNNRTMIIGDAAHPSSSCTSFPASDAHVPTVLPHMAGGAMSAIEDAESLAAVLQFEPKSNINSALNRAFRIRFKRASFFQLSSVASSGVHLSHMRRMSRIGITWAQ